MKERVLITGANGFVGSHLVEAAVQRGMEVYAAIRPTSHTTHLESYPIQYTTLNYAEPEALVRALEEKQYHYIIHAAGITKAKNAEVYNLVNAEYTKNLAMAAIRAEMPLKKFVFISSLAALGPKGYGDTLPIDEQSDPKPLTSYGKSKLLAENHILGAEGLPLVVLRPTAVYGPLEKDLFLLMKTLNSGLDLYIGRQEQRLSFIYVKDLARAVMLSLKAKAQPVCYNLSDGNSYDRYAFANITKRMLRKDAVRFHLPLKLVKAAAWLLEVSYSGKAMPVLNREKLSELTAENWNCSIDKMKDELGFIPEYDLEKGLAFTLKWYKDNKWF